MALSLQRQGEIARIALKYKLQEDGLKIFSRERFLSHVCEGAKELDINEKEFIEFVELLVREMVSEMLDQK